MDRKIIILLITLTVIFTFYRIWEPFVFFTDELQLEEISFQMFKTKNFMIPRFNGDMFLNKPPLYSWLTASFYFIFPPNAVIRRLWTAIFALGLIFITYKFSGKYFGKETAFWSVLFLLGNSIYIEFTKAGNLDIPNAFFSFLIIYLYNLSKNNSRWYYILAITLGISFLNRFYLSLLPIPAIIADILFCSRDKFKLKEIFYPLLLFIVIALPWYLAVYIIYPKVFVANFIDFNLMRHILYSAPGDSIEPIWFYLSIISIMPVSILSVVAIFKRFFKRKPCDNITFQITFYIISVFIVLSFFATRHIWYIIPLIPPIAILAGTFYTNLLSYLSQKKQDILKIILMEFTIGFIVSPFIAFAGEKNLSAETVRSIEIINGLDKLEPLFTYPYPYIYNTTLFKPREIKNIASKSELEKVILQRNNTYILVKKDLKEDFGGFNLKTETVFRGENYMLIKISH